jgi:hypothetical protein
MTTKLRLEPEDPCEFCRIGYYVLGGSLKGAGYPTDAAEIAREGDGIVYDFPVTPENAAEVRSLFEIHGTVVQM